MAAEDLIEILTPDFEYGDERGFLCQLVHEGYRQINVVYSNAGSVRGGHYHELNNEAFYVVSGSFEVVAEKDGDSLCRTFKKGDMFLLRRGVCHSFNYLEDTVLVGLYDLGIELENGEKDMRVVAQTKSRMNDDIK